MASTIFWLLTLAFYYAVDWHSAWMILGAAYVIVCVPLHWVCLSGPERDLSALTSKTSGDWPELTGPERKRGMRWMVVSIIFSGYLMGTVMTLWVTNVQDLGHSAALAAFADAVIDPVWVSNTPCSRFYCAGSYARCHALRHG